MSNQQPQQSPPNIDRLARRLGKYALVVAVSQRTRELKDRQSRMGDLAPSNLIARALNEIAEGRVKLIEEKEE